MTQTIVNLGTGGAVLNGRNGSTTGADSNDALFLDWTGLDYVYLPGVAGNFMSVPDAAALDITGDIDIRAKVALDDWTPATNQRIMGKLLSTGDQRSWSFYVETSGVIGLEISETGTFGTTSGVNSTVATGITDGAVKWVRATWRQSDGRVQFFLSDDDITYTQLGTDRTLSKAGIYASTATLIVGSYISGSSANATGKFYRAQIFNGIDGTKVLDVDTSVITSGAATSFNALTGQTVTINRGTAGRKAVAVVSPVWLFGTDDYMEVADNDLIDFGASDSFTVLAVLRQWGTQTGAGGYVVKRSQNVQPGNVGWSLVADNGGTRVSVLRIDDGTTANAVVSPAVSDGAIVVMNGVRDTIADNIIAYTGATASTPVTDTTTATLSNSVPVRIGRWSNVTSNYSNFELLAVAVFRRALTATEITAITTYYQARLS